MASIKYKPGGMTKIPLSSAETMAQIGVDEARMKVIDERAKALTLEYMEKEDKKKDQMSQEDKEAVAASLEEEFAEEAANIDDDDARIYHFYCRVGKYFEKAQRQAKAHGGARKRSRSVSIK